MEQASLGDNPAAFLPGYSIDAHITSGGLNFGCRKAFRLKAKLSDSLAIYLSKTPLSDDQKVSYRDGSRQFTATVQDSWQLQFWNLSQGRGITVTSPKTFRDRIKGELRAACERY